MMMTTIPTRKTVTPAKTTKNTTAFSEESSSSFFVEGWNDMKHEAKEEWNDMKEDVGREWNEIKFGYSKLFQRRTLKTTTTKKKRKEKEVKDPTTTRELQQQQQWSIKLRPLFQSTKQNDTLQKIKEKEGKDPATTRVPQQWSIKLRPLLFQSTKKDTILQWKKEQIRDYEGYIREHNLSVLNASLETLLPSGQTMMEYYQGRPELEEYTMTKELERIKHYTIIDDNKRMVMQHSHEVRTYYHNMKNKKDNNEFVLLLWRCANQSLLADIIVALTAPSGLIRPQMEAGTSVEEISFQLHFGKAATTTTTTDESSPTIPPHVRAECVLNISIPDILDNQQREENTNNNNDDRLFLLRIQLQVYFCPTESKFRATVKSVVPYPKLTESQLHRAATELSLSPPSQEEQSTTTTNERASLSREASSSSLL